MRVGIIALIQESNTFLSGRTTIDDFRNDVLLQGEEVREYFAKSHHEVGGFFHGLAAEQVEAVPIFAARSIPNGLMTHQTFHRLLEMIGSSLSDAGKLDGLLLAPHGATGSENEADADGHWLAQVRARVGPAMPLIATLDPHANLSPHMVKATDALIAYRTNPHMDQLQRGVEAATLMARTLRGEVRPVQAGAFPPMAINIECQDTSRPPCRPLFDRADAMVRDTPAVLTNSIILGFPYSDVRKMGSSVVVVTDDNSELAQELARNLAGQMWSDRSEFLPTLISSVDAVERASHLDGPACLLDMGDNVGGGSPGDSTVLAHLLHHRKMNAFVCITDPDCARKAHAAGMGVHVQMSIGGKSTDSGGNPLYDNFTVVSLHDGRFTEPQPRHGGFTQFDQGPTAVVRASSGVVIMLTSLRMAPFSLRQLTAFGVDPSSFHVLVAKGVHAPVAAYQSVCRHFIRVNTPGVTTADMDQLPYQHRRRPMFPFEPDAKWAPVPNQL